MADTVIISIAQLKENEMEQPIFTKSLPEYLPEFFEALTTQIYKDNLRWGDTWKERPVEGQEHRMFARFQDYYDQFKNAGTPMPWLKIAGEAFIGFIREKYTRNNPD